LIRNHRDAGAYYELVVRGVDGRIRRIAADAVVLGTGFSPVGSFSFIKAPLAAELGLPLPLNLDIPELKSREGEFASIDALEQERLISSTFTLAHPPYPLRTTSMFSSTDHPKPSTPSSKPSPARLFRGIAPIDSISDRNIAFCGFIATITNALHIQVRSRLMAPFQVV
jgi:hypothetical protein